MTLTTSYTESLVSWKLAWIWHLGSTIGMTLMHSGNICMLWWASTLLLLPGQTSRLDVDRDLLKAAQLYRVQSGVAIEHRTITSGRGLKCTEIIQKIKNYWRTYSS